MLQRRLASLLLLSSLAAPALAADEPPTADTLKQVLEKRLLSLKPQGYTERQVLFQEVRPGKPSGGGYPFQVTAIIRDYGPGYPANRFYGATCLSRMDKYVFTLSRDAFSDWQVQGRMTVTDKYECKDNPSEGASSFPLASLPGSPAPKPTAGAAGSAAPPATPAAKTAPQPAGTAAQTGVMPGSYECWFFSQPRPGLNFEIKEGGRYVDVEGVAGTYSYDAATGQIAFRGGALDEQKAAYPNKPTPTVSFRNAQGREIAFCERAR